MRRTRGRAHPQAVWGKPVRCRASLLSELTKSGKRAGNNFLSSWRQIAIIPFAGQSIEREAFANLFPGVEIPPINMLMAFPSSITSFPEMSIDSTRGGGWEPFPWRAIVPHIITGDSSATDLLFYREHRWEDDALSVTEGHIHFGAQFNIAMAGVFFYKRLIERLHFDPERKSN